VSLFHAIILLVALARLVELFLAGRNARRLLADGALEVGRAHYPLIVTLHAAWFAAMLVTIPADAPAHWPWLAFFLLLQGARLWVLRSLGRYWTTRIITLPGAPLVRRGPYRFIRHPNYLLVELEIVTLPMAFGAVMLALAFGLANAALLAWRIRIEEDALAPRRAAGGPRETA
jgi:methyltransferase